ncbi:TlpA family protein disulfide reductase [Candidatus Latescibacterota bacterium]
MRLRYVLSIFLCVLFAGTGEAADLVVGDAFPSFFLKDIDGNNFFYNDYIGEKARFETGAMIFSFGASYCEPCKREIPELGKIAEKYRDAGLRVFLIAMEPQDRAQKLVEETGTTLPLLLDRYLVVQKLIGFEGIPYTVVVDSDGLVQFINTGFSESNVREAMESFEELLRGILGGGSAPADASAGSQ